MKNINLLYNDIDKHVNMHVYIIDRYIYIYSLSDYEETGLSQGGDSMPFIGWHPGKSTQIPDGFIPFSDAKHEYVPKIHAFEAILPIFFHVFLF